MGILYAAIESNNVWLWRKASGMRYHLGERDAGQHFSLRKILHRMRPDAMIRVVSARARAPEISTFLSRGGKETNAPISYNVQWNETSKEIINNLICAHFIHHSFRNCVSLRGFRQFFHVALHISDFQECCECVERYAPVRSAWHLIWWIVLWSERYKLKHWRRGGIAKSKRRKYESIKKGFSKLQLQPVDSRW